jgi:hypothetical protein
MKSREREGGCYGSTELAIVVPGATWRKILMEKQDEVFCFCFSSLSGAWIRRGPERSRARRFWRGGANP